MKKHLFFDLDHTLWDFNRNSHETLSSLFFTYKLGNSVAEAEQFIKHFHEANYHFWSLYDQNLISKHELRNNRLQLALEKSNIKTQFDYELFNEEYLNTCPYKTNLIPFAIEILEFYSSSYEIHILTNGFQEIQERKISNSGIEHYIKNLFTAETLGVKKPQKEFFEKVIDTLGTSSEYCVMIGDTFDADIKGAISVNIDAIYFNPENLTFENHSQIKSISCLSELKNLL